MSVEKCAPRSITHCCGPLRRVDDVGKQDGGEHPLGVTGGPDSGQELLHFVDQTLGISGEECVVIALELPVHRSGYVFGQISTVFGAHMSVPLTVDHESGRLD